ncbi:MAG TPA: PQQ-binding-like beta-propeller repeat protein, partial [Vicinamibacterales bacterium]|nr:PQQ-binding-like beta-propeller repeat protein [Vicinamibacterales bacterium]
PRTTAVISHRLALAVGVLLSVSARGQPPAPRPFPAPRTATPKVDRTPLALTPVENVWGLALNNALAAAPAFEGARAFFAIEGDRLAAYDLIDGTQQWLVTAHAQMAPVAGGGFVFIREADRLLALRSSDGVTAWQLPIADKLAVHPVWDNGWLILALASGEVRALRATDGQLIWTRDLKSAAHAPPALAADRVYVPTDDSRIVALRVESGETIWERRLGGAPNEILALDERLFAGAQDHFFYCVMAADAKVDWRVRTGGDVIGKPVADDHYVYFVSLDNVLRAMNMVTGGQQWMRPLPMRPAWGAVRAGSTIVVAGLLPPMRAYNIKDGTTAGTLTGIVTQPAEVPTGAAAPGEEPQKRTPPPFVALPGGAEVAAAPYMLEQPLTRAPMLLMLFRDIATGASATLVGHTVEPALVPAVAQLPNLIQIAPVTPTTPPPRP